MSLARCRAATSCWSWARGENLLICLITSNFSWNMSVFVSSAPPSCVHMLIMITPACCSLLTRQGRLNTHRPVASNSAAYCIRWYLHHMLSSSLQSSPLHVYIYPALWRWFYVTRMAIGLQIDVSASRSIDCMLLWTLHPGADKLAFIFNKMHLSILKYYFWDKNTCILFFKHQIFVNKYCIIFYINNFFVLM